MSILMNSVGHLFDPLKLKESDLFDLDIVLSKSLSKIPRFCGILNEFYSVAQHCLSMVDYMEANEYSEEWIKITLSHEFYEGFASGDIPDPIKKEIQLLQDIEFDALELFARKHNLCVDYYYSDEFRRIDKGIMVTEALALAPESDYNWLTVAEPLGRLYKLHASIKEIEEDFKNKWNEYFN